MRRCIIGVMLGMVLVAAGCSGKKPAPAQAPENPTVMPPTDEKGKVQIPQASKQAMTP